MFQNVSEIWSEFVRICLNVLEIWFEVWYEFV